MPTADASTPRDRRAQPSEPRAPGTRPSSKRQPSTRAGSTGTARPAHERPRVRIEDPREIRALAHPARLAVLDELFAGRELTATECAEIAGLSPSAMSYHLRALERAGIVERAESSDGRERPWRAAGSGIEVHTRADSPLAGAATATVANAVLADATAQLNAWLAGMAQEDERWRELAGFSSARLWLTVEEAEHVAQQILDIVERYGGRTEEQHPEGARRMRLGVLFFPLPEATATRPPAE